GRCMIFRGRPRHTEYVPESVPSRVHHRLDRAGVRIRRVAREGVLRPGRRDEPGGRGAFGRRRRGADFLRALLFEENEERKLSVNGITSILTQGRASLSERAGGMMSACT